MITRPLDLASKLRPPPRSLDALFFVNAGLLVLFFSLFGSNFVLAPGLGVDFVLPKVAGANESARSPTHAISVTNAGQIIAPQGSVTLADLGVWLRAQAPTVAHPVLLVRGSGGAPTSLQADIVARARAAGFAVIWAAEEPAPGAGRGGR